MLDSLDTSCPPTGLAGLRVHLAAAAEARRRGDHAAADCHEAEALRVLRASLASDRHGCRA